MKSIWPQGAKPGDLTLVPSVLRAGGDRYRIPAEFGRLIVPKDRSRPSEGLIELTFVRLKSTASHPRPPVFVLAGGPGGSGIGMLQGEALVPWFEALRGLCDVVAFDQRGVGQSTPNLESPLRWEIPLDRPLEREEFLRIAKERSRALADYWRTRGINLNAYVTTENADDIDALRAALGYEKIVPYGGSYGSHLSLAYIKRHDKNVARALIGLVEGPDHTIKLPSNIQRLLEHVDRMAAADPRMNSKIPSFLGLMRQVLEGLEREPMRVEAKDERTGETVKVAFGAFDLRQVSATGLGNTSFIRTLPARYFEMAQGNFSWLASEVLKRRTGWLPSAMTFMMDAASGASAERRKRIQAEAGGTILRDTIDLPFPYVEDAWGSPDLGETFRAPVQSNVPVLFHSGTLDGRTPVSNAEEVRAGFPNAQHLVLENAGHSFHEFTNHPQVRQTMLDFLQERPITPPKASIPFEFTPLPS